MSKDDAISIMNNSNLIDKKGALKFFLLIYKKWVSTLKKLIIRRTKTKDYYENVKERLREQARDIYRNLSEEEKNKKRDYGRRKYHNISKEEKQKPKEYQKQIPWG